MIYDIRQTAVCSYGWPVPSGRHIVRFLPLEKPGQTVVSSRISVDPMPLEQERRTDFFGNQTVYLVLHTPHTLLTVRMAARVRVDPAKVFDAATTPTWEDVCSEAIKSRDLSAASPAHYLFPSRRVALTADIGAYAHLSFPPCQTVLAGALDLMHRLKADFTYQSGVTDAATSPQEAFEARHGVCQDFSHVMIAGLRWLGLPARYVSGYLRTYPLPGRPRLEGADAMHAWVSVWCGAAYGWVELDPTNDILGGEDHIVAGFGRDYADVAPLDGIVVTSGAHELEMSVDVAALEERPAV